MLEALVLVLSMQFSTMDAAAHAGLVEAMQCSDNKVECGGVIYQASNGTYVYTKPINGKKQFGIDLDEPINHGPKGYKLVADYHVHICNSHNAPFSPYFSPADAYTNQGFHTIGYMYSFCDSMIHRYDPSQDDRDDEEIDFKPHPDGTVHPPIYLTIGHINGYIPQP